MADPAAAIRVDTLLRDCHQALAEARSALLIDNRADCKDRDELLARMKKLMQDILQELEPE